jgi:hypothetical protein
LSGLKKSLKAFNAYINGGSSEALSAQFDSYYNHKPHKIAQDFHKTAIGEYNNLRKQILNDLNIPERFWGQYSKERSIYDFFVMLAQEGHPQMGYLLETIDNKTRISNLELSLRFSLLTPFLAILLSVPIFQMGVTILKHFLTSLSIPLIGGIFTLVTTSYRLYSSATNIKQHAFNRWRDSLFILATVPINFLAYGLLIVGSSLLSPFIGLLFVAASGLHVAKEVFCLIQEIYRFKTRPPFEGEDWRIIHKAYARSQYDYEKRLIAVGINIATALVLFAVMAIACIIPAGFTVTFATMAAMAVIYLVQSVCLSINERKQRESLQFKLHEIDVSYTFTIQPEEELDNCKTEALSEDTYPSSSYPFFSPSGKESSPKCQPKQGLISQQFNPGPN